MSLTHALIAVQDHDVWFLVLIVSGKLYSWEIRSLAKPIPSEGTDSAKVLVVIHLARAVRLYHVADVDPMFPSPLIFSAQEAILFQLGWSKVDLEQDIVSLANRTSLIKSRT